MSVILYIILCWLIFVDCQSTDANDAIVCQNNGDNTNVVALSRLAHTVTELTTEVRLSVVDFTVVVDDW